jgi:hypothetical protein
MNAAERRAVAEVLESYFEPDSPEALACAMYALRLIFERAKPKTARNELPALPQAHP